MTDIEAIKKSFAAELNQRVDAGVELAQGQAAAITLSPFILNGLAQNVDWLLRQAVHDLEFASGDDDDEDGLKISVGLTRKMVLNFAVAAKGLREFAELLQGLEAFRQEQGEAA